MTASRSRLTPGSGSLSLVLEGAPAGVGASGTIAPNGTSGTLSFWVDASVAPQSLPHLRVRASSGGVSGSAPFGLTIDPPLPPGQISPNGVQASGQAQTGGALANTPVIQEPVAATNASDSVQVVGVRHGYYPSATSR